ncbi:hypothetical protein WDZ17_05125 [Pseudokineococcus basanitobsidens]|uniref:DUF559 domain-containing protein n=1 Tax=Pseudokineococcus basanitobsidens TaxID=1926649 RepID=A0ABU8RI00_9ACTN
MDAVGTLLDDLARRGGTAAVGALVRDHGRSTVDRAVTGGEVDRVGWGVCALATTPTALRAAASVRGVVSHSSAAQLWMVEPLHRPGRVCVTVPRTARRRRPLPGTHLRWADLSAADVEGPVTSPLRTALDCARSMPFPEALGIADGFLRRGLVTPGELVSAAVALRGAGRAAAVTVAAAADGRSANPFESALRAVVLRSGAGSFVPQVVVDAGPLGLVRPDLVDEGRCLVLEADSFAWHGSRPALVRDCERYNALVLAGFLVLRFTWEQVVGAPEGVAEAVRRAVALVDAGRGERGDLQKCRPGPRSRP